MSTLDLILLGIIIASNNLSFAFGMGALGTGAYHLRIVGIFTLIEFVIPLIGLYIGHYMSAIIQNYAALLGSIILIALGIYTIITTFKSKKDKETSLEYLTSVKGLFLIALGLSVDNLMVGFSFGLVDEQPLRIAFFIAFCSMIFTFIGLKTGKFVRKSLGKYVQAAAGVILIILGVINLFS